MGGARAINYDDDDDWHLTWIHLLVLRAFGKCKEGLDFRVIF